MQNLTIVMAQIDTLVGDIQGNTEKIVTNALNAEKTMAADIVVFPELTLTGYPPEDLLLRASLTLRVEKALIRLKQANQTQQCCWVIGLPFVEEGKLYNGAIALFQGEELIQYGKQCLPNYQVFDEKRYFSAGSKSGVFRFKQHKIALNICEDIWHDEPLRQAAERGVDLVLNLNASPFHQGKVEERRQILSQRIANVKVPIVYVNAVGGQDELVFDGGSMALDADQQCLVQADFFKEQLCPVHFCKANDQLVLQSGYQAQLLSSLESLYQALVLSVKDYVNKNGFKGALLGLSGGIDSALTLAIAVDALGADRVMAIMMPFVFTSAMSKTDAKQQAQNLAIEYDEIAIQPMYDAFMSALAVRFADSKKDTTEENLQARCRGILLMALSNKKHYMVLTTGNKSEMSVGYATLYGDMVGGFNPLKDIPKTTVFALARWVNQQSPSQIIPERVISRPPSAELSADQKDEDSLPPYAELDAILYHYIEQDRSAEQIVALGFADEVVKKVIRLVDINEFKRRQAVVGTRVSKRAFGKDRRYPITHGWHIGE